MQKTLYFDQAGLGDNLAVPLPAVVLAADGQSYSLPVVSNASWSATLAKQDWLVVNSPQVRYDKNATLQLQAAANTTKIERKAVLLLTAGKKKVSYLVTQAAYGSNLTLSPIAGDATANNGVLKEPNMQGASLIWNLNSFAQLRNLNLQVDHGYKITNTGSKWLKVTPAAKSIIPGSSQTVKLTMSAAANLSGTSRHAKLIIMCAGKRFEVIINQSAGSQVYESFSFAAAVPTSPLALTEPQQQLPSLQQPEAGNTSEPASAGGNLPVWQIDARAQLLLLDEFQQAEAASDDADWITLLPAGNALWFEANNTAVARYSILTLLHLPSGQSKQVLVIQQAP